MRSPTWCACGLAVLLLASGPARAQEKAGKDVAKKAVKRAAKAGRPKPAKDTRSARSRNYYSSRFDLERLAKELDLSADQKKLIADAVEVQQEAAREQEKADEAKMKELFEQSKKIREEMEALSTERHRRRDSYKAKVAELLTAGQKARWVQWRLKDSLMRYYWSLKFTDAQTQKIDALIAEAAAKIVPMTPEQQEKAADAAVAELRKAIDALVPPEQVKQSRIDSVAEQTLRMFHRAELTEEQTARVKALAAAHLAEQAKAGARVEALRKEMNELHMKSRTGGYNELAKKVRETVLTDEQRAKYPARGERGKRPDPPSRTRKPGPAPAKPRD